ncbi:MAG: hypothetical protein GF317_06075 [Candidatus Lokiarchaeota archaeon]|nr:hypothetical protein [Candidatus Lokiarchaeota archaeon]
MKHISNIPTLKGITNNYDKIKDIMIPSFLDDGSYLFKREIKNIHETDLSTKCIFCDAKESNICKVIIFDNLEIELFYDNKKLSAIIYTIDNFCISCNNMYEIHILKVPEIKEKVLLYINKNFLDEAIFPEPGKTIISNQEEAKRILKSITITD